VLQVNKISVAYNHTPAINDISFGVNEGEIVTIVGSNGAGKSTILKAISGLLHASSGKIIFNGEAIQSHEPFVIVQRGLAHVPEGRRLFSKLNVIENLLLGAYTNKSEDRRKLKLKEIFEIFPILKERQKQKAGTLSGGEQQMLAIGRALMLEPKLLMLDEPSLGIMPLLVDRIFEIIARINEAGMTILLVEQNVQQALELAHRAYVLQTGQIVLEGEGQELLNSDMVRAAFLGL
jgi:branched-chain amino acid transport system ATP-binding protein